MKTFFVSAIVPVHNGKSFIAETIESLLEQTKAFDEIIVVDDGSTDRTVEVVKRFKRVRIIQIRHAERVKSRNIGWKASKGNVVAFIDSDLVLTKDWLKEVLKGFEQGHVAVVDRRAVYKPETYIAKMNDHFFDLRYANNYKPFTLWIIRRDVLEDLGGYDEKVVGIEDADLADRVQAKGHEIYFAKKAIAYHKGEPKTLYGELWRHFWFGSHILPYWKKLRHVKRPLRAFVFLMMSVLFFFRPLYTALFFLLCYGYALFKDLFYWKMQLKYLFVHPFIVVLSEFAYAYGVLYGSFFGPLRLVRRHI